jgi:hypothetical protein
LRARKTCLLAIFYFNTVACAMSLKAFKKNNKIRASVYPFPGAISRWRETLQLGPALCSQPIAI